MVAVQALTHSSGPHSLAGVAGGFDNVTEKLRESGMDEDAIEKDIGERRVMKAKGGE